MTTCTRSLEEREETWAEAAEAIDWIEPWMRVLDDSRAPFYSPTRAAPGWDLRVLGSDGAELPNGETGALVARLPMRPGGASSTVRFGVVAQQGDRNDDYSRRQTLGSG